MDALIGGIVVGLGVAFVVVGALLSRSLDGLACAIVLTGGVVVALFGATIASSGRVRRAGRRDPHA